MTEKSFDRKFCSGVFNLCLSRPIGRIRFRWKPSAYLGSYGDIRKANVRNDLRNWSSGQDDRDGQQT